MTPERGFYTDALKEFHELAKREGVGNENVILIPELHEIGSEFVLSELRDGRLMEACGNEPTTYYLLITRISLDGGIAFADKWHEHFSEIKDGSFMNQMLNSNVMEYVSPAVQKEFGKSKEEWIEFQKKVFMKWAELHQPYWKLQDPRAYTMQLFQAVFQLGVSLILQKYGY